MSAAARQLIQTRLLPKGDKARLVIGLGMVLAAVTFGCAVLLIWNDRQGQLRDWSRNLSSVSTTLAAQAEQTLRAADLVIDTVEDLVRDQRVGNAAEVVPKLGTRSFYDALRLRIANVSQVAVITIVSNRSDIVNFTRSYPPSPISLTDRDLYNAVRHTTEKGSFLSVPVQSRATGEWTVYLARPILALDGTSVGLVIAGINLNVFNAFYRAMNLGDHSAISLFRTDGVLLTREPLDSGMIGQSFGANPSFRRMLAASEVNQGSLIGHPPLPAGANLRTMMISPSLVTGFPVLADITVPEDVLLVSWYRTARNVTMLTLGLIAAMFCMTFLLARLFERQDKTLKDLTAARLDAEDAASVKTALLDSLHASQEQLTGQSTILKVTLENIDQGLMMVAADGTVPLCSRRAIELLGLPPELMATRPLFRAVVDYQTKMGEFISAPVRQAHVPGSAVIMTRPQTYERTRPNGTILEVQTIPLPDGGMVRTFTDITGRRKSEEQIRFYAHHDGLTGLVNRVVFQNTLSAAIANASDCGEGLAVHYLDLDGFKLVNDTHGHIIGDRLLIEVAARLRQAVRDTDTVARMGGDEFAIIQPIQGDQTIVGALAHKIRATIGEPYAISGSHCTVGLSIGVSLFPDHAADADTLLGQADIALYHAKANDKGAFCVFHEGMDKRRQSAFLLEQALNQALSRNEFFLEYQPIVDATTLRPACFEALVRWQHPSLGVIPPDDFITLAERSGLIIALGRWVLDTACREAATWPPDISLSVNVSPVQFSRGNLFEQVEDALRASGLQPSRLILEVTEGVLLEDSEGVLATMTSLGELDVRFSLDDFGTAHSRLAYLCRFPFDVIKIDRSFVGSAVEQEGERAIVNAMLAIGRAFRLSVVAEGVERASQLDLLRELGCKLVQGYLTGRPLRVPALPATAQASGKEARIA